MGPGGGCPGGSMMGGKQGGSGSWGRGQARSTSRDSRSTGWWQHMAGGLKRAWSAASVRKGSSGAQQAQQNANENTVKKDPQSEDGVESPALEKAEWDGGWEEGGLDRADL